MLDPLGLAVIADRLANDILPGMTARMWRPRFLTAIAVAAVILEPFEEVISSDGTSKPYVVFEWFMIEAFARSEGNARERGGRIPGIEKARRAKRDGVPMSARRYLKTPTVFGIHGVYKTLARALDITDSELVLSENGYRLLRLWEREQGLEGFTDTEAGDGARLRKRLQGLIDNALRNGQTVENHWWRFFVKHLHPDDPGASERRVISELMLSPEGGTRGEVFRLLTLPEIRSRFYRSGNEGERLRAISEHAGRELRVRIARIQAYESVCVFLTRAFDWLRYLSTQARATPIGPSHLEPRVVSLIEQLANAISRTRRLLDGSGHTLDFETLAGPFEDVRSATRLYEALLEHHGCVQQAKPPSGKRTWFERTTNGNAIVRAPYRLVNPPSSTYRHQSVHGYRMQNVLSFVGDLRLPRQ